MLNLRAIIHMNLRAIIHMMPEWENIKEIENVEIENVE